MVVVVVRVERICVGEGSILERHGEKKASPNVRNTEFNHNNESQNHRGAARVSRRVSQHVPRRRCGGALAAFALALPRAFVRPRDPLCWRCIGQTFSGGEALPWFPRVARDDRATDLYLVL